MLKLPKIPSNVLSSNAGIINEFYSDDNDNFALSFNYEVKISEVKENFDLLKYVQDAFASPLRKGQHRVKGTKGV